MASVEITISGIIYDKYSRTTRPVAIIGEASLTGLGVGGGPIIPPDSGEGPPQIWGPPGPWPTPPIYLPPNLTPAPPDNTAVVKPPPEAGGWGYFPEYGWGYFPAAGAAGPKAAPAKK